MSVTDSRIDEADGGSDLAVSDDLYEVLQVHPNAEPEIIEAAYRRLVRLYHPDINNSADAHEITVNLNGAYDILGDPRKRAEYDHSRTAQTHEQNERESESTEQADGLPKTEREYHLFVEDARKAQAAGSDYYQSVRLDRALFRAILLKDISSSRKTLGIWSRCKRSNRLRLDTSPCCSE